MLGFVDQANTLWDFEYGDGNVTTGEGLPNGYKRRVWKAFDVAAIELVRTLFVDVDLGANPVDMIVSRCDDAAFTILEFYFPKCAALVMELEHESNDEEEADANRTRN